MWEEESGGVFGTCKSRGPDSLAPWCPPTFGTYGVVNEMSSQFQLQSPLSPVDLKISRRQPLGCRLCYMPKRSVSPFDRSSFNNSAQHCIRMRYRAFLIREPIFTSIIIVTVEPMNEMEVSTVPYLCVYCGYLWSSGGLNLQTL